jgi:S1-C subfamily serine protease
MWIDHARGTVLVGMVVATVAMGARSAAGDVRPSVVKIHATRRAPSVFRPWTKQEPEEVSGSGAVIDGKRILTNAHVVNYASQVYVQPFQSADRIAAKTVVIAPGIDLALLEVDDQKFFEDHPALKLADRIPSAKESVNVYGYPVGGTELSVTEGIVARIEYAGYSYGEMGLRIQVDAAINAGNSGGPAIVEEEIIGLVSSRIRQADNIGYLIPVEEIRMFLEDVSDGRYDGKPHLFDDTQTVENEALRTKLGLTSGVGGAMVATPWAAGSDYPLRRWDVITKIGDHALDNDGKVRVREDLRLYFLYMVPKLAVEDRVGVTLLRNGESTEAAVPTLRERDLVIPYLKTEYPRYFVYGPLVFSAATQEFAGSLADAWFYRLVYCRSPLVTRRYDKVAFEGEELVVVCSPMFPHRITKGYDNPFSFVLKSVNDVEIRSLRHLVAFLRDLRDEDVVFAFADEHTETLVFDRKEIAASTEEILNDNGIRHECSEDLRDVWKGEE